MNNLQSKGDSNFTGIDLNHENHIYKLKRKLFHVHRFLNPSWLSKMPEFLVYDNKFQFTSVTEFIYQFFRKFDQQKIAKKLTSEHPKYIDMTIDQLIEQWSKGAKRGTIVHNELELFINEGVEPKHELATTGWEWIKDKQKNPDNIFHSEVIVYSKKLAIAGTIDLLIHNKKSDTYHLIDWKTNKRIDEQSFGGKKGILKSTEHLDDCNFNHYSLQLSFYRYILENHYGLKVDKQLLFHLKRNNYKIYDINYHKEDLVDMLEEKELL